ncbi:MAG: NADH-quinone oxidoreductase subunit L [Anaerolineaceae bacterium]|nr:NADH-quinone oxidoreductase subunit L [Anaerolineaceae bacterium]
MTSETLLWIIPALPLLAFALVALFFHRSRTASHGLAVGAAGLSWAASMVVFVRALSTPELSAHPFESSIAWLPMADTWLRIGVQVDPLTAVTLFFVAWTVLMIFIYSIGYHNYGQPVGDHDAPGLPPHGASVTDASGHRHAVPSVEPMYARFFAFISLFAFAMFSLVLTDNLLVLYIAWEIMGLCSYLLIGFWYAKESARNAAVKAFLTTRVGDMFMMLGLVALYTQTGSLRYGEVLSSATLSQLTSSISPVFSLSWAGLIGLLLFAGTVGKSAQFPLHVWLPDAMEGPTPVSAMIHAATMVSAGVYLVVRFFPLISAGWAAGEPLNPAMASMAFIGAFTALFAALIAVGQNDIKRVLAYSTISQLGYMVAALGIGAYVAAVFHLVTHAFFKALLFLGSGSVIHGMEHGTLHTGETIDPQDMFNMGGLRRRMPVTFWTFLLGGLALSGFPLVTAGFWSKDEILSGAFHGGHLAVFIVLAVAAFLTAFYTMRQITLTFLGEARTTSAAHAGENRPVMVLPLVVLAFFAVTAGWVGIPENFPLIGGLAPAWFEHFVGSMLHEAEAVEAFSFVPLATSLLVALGGLALGWLVYRRIPAGRPDPLRRPLGVVYTWLQNKFYVDELYQAVFIRPSLWLAETFTYRWIDLGILDGILHAMGRLALWLGGVLRNGFDVPVVNGGGDAVGAGSRGLGRALKAIQTGRVQQYMFLSMATVVVVILFYYFVILA